MEKRELLDNISHESLMQMKPCFDPTWRTFRAGETIITYEPSSPKQVLILLHGTARLMLLNEDGNIFMLEKYRDGDIFGELFSLPLDTFEYIVVADTPCRIMYISYEHIIRPCSKLCDHHSQLISNMFVMAAQKSQELSFHISILHQGTIRQKLMAYLTYVGSTLPKAEDGAFRLPITLAELADYLSVDRSAMMREIKSMKSDGLIESSRREFKILC